MQNFVCVSRRRNRIGAGLLIALVGSYSSFSFAADPIPSIATGAPVHKATRDYNSLVIGGWLVDPSLFVGAVYDSNINQTQTNRVSGWGVRVVPSLIASLNNGIHQTTLYGSVDGRFYAASGATDKTQIAAKAGVAQVYEAQRDLIFRFTGDFTRQQDVFGSWSFVQNPASNAGTPGALSAPAPIAPQTSPTFYNSVTGAAAATKIFNRAFVTAGFMAQHTTFDQNLVGNRNGTIYTIPVRFGFYVTPQIYAFADPQVDWRRYEDSLRDSSGYRATAGLGTDQGIWSGEVFGGYQQQKNNIVGTYSGDVYGLRLTYSPTRLWTVRATVDQTLSSASVVGTPATAFASRSTTALANFVYGGLPTGWGANGRFGYIRTEVVNTTRRDDGWLAGANLSYALWRNLSLTLDYQYTSVDSNTALQSYNRHMVSLGASYKY